MSITDIKFRKVFPSGKLKAIVSVTFDDQFVVHDMKIIDGHQGLFVAMPNKKTANGGFRDVCHPISSQAREMLESEILLAFESYMKEMESADRFESQNDNVDEILNGE